MNAIVLNKHQKAKYFKYIKETYSNCFLKSSIDSIKFDVLSQSFFHEKSYKSRGSFDNAMYLCELWSRHCPSGWESNQIEKHKMQRYLKLLIAAKHSISFERYDLTIRINKILIFYFSKHI